VGGRETNLLRSGIISPNFFGLLIRRSDEESDVGCMEYRMGIGNGGYLE
jgi:hypothetical protein